MEKSKIWAKDRLKISDFQVGQKVLLIRRKINGHPKGIKDNQFYEIKRIENDCLILKSGKSIPPEFKVHFSYFISIQLLRNETIDDLLSD